MQDDWAELAPLLASTATAARVITERSGSLHGVAIVPVRMLDTPRLFVIEAVPYDYLMAPATAARHGSLAVGLIALICALGLAGVISRSLAQPLVQMTRAIQSFARSETLDLPITAGGEIGVLARAFAGMNASVREKSAALEREIEERRLVFDSSLDLILVVDRQGNLIRVSPSSLAILGYSPEEMVGHSAGLFIYSSDLDNTRREMQLARRGRQMRNFECRYVHKDGRVVTLVWNGIWSEPAQLHFFTGRDMTEQKIVEKKFELAVEACPSGMIMTDSAGKIVMVNTEVEHLFGYRREELIGTTPDILTPVRFRLANAMQRDGLALNPESGRMGAARDLFGLRKDGTEFPVEIGLNAIDTHEGLLTLSVIVDITERKHHERIKHEFVATVSHELRTPLTSICASLGLLTGTAAGKLPDSVMRLLTIAHTNSQRLVRLINDILDIEKIESGKMAFDLKPVAVRDIVEQAIEANRGFAEDYGVVVTLDPNSIDGVILADADRLTQVVTNLVSNAVKFSPQNQPVTVSIGHGLDDRLRINVRDHGPGIPDHYKYRIFEKFVQVDATDTRQKGGTGLGLSIVKQIVERFAGQVGFNSAEGGGTVFHVDFPPWDSSVPLVSIAEVDGAPRILLCEDDPDSAAIIGDRLRRAGLNTDICYTAEAAVREASAIAYAAILVDLQLPDSDGITLIKRLRAQPHYHNTPIVVVSADPDRGRDDERSAALNVLDWLSKPVDIDRLVRVLNRPIVREASGRPRILHVDSDRDVLNLVANALVPTADVISTESIAEARLTLARYRFDLVVLDVALAEGFGLDLLPDLYDAEGNAIPIIVFSAQDTPEIAARVLAVLSKSRASIDSLVSTLQKLVARQPFHSFASKEVA